jgi:hypothetical protein
MLEPKYHRVYDVLVGCRPLDSNCAWRAAQPYLIWLRCGARTRKLAGLLAHHLAHTTLFASCLPTACSEFARSAEPVFFFWVSFPSRQMARR